MLLWGCETALVRQVAQYEQVRDYASAVQLLEREVQRNPANAEAQYHLGRLYFREQRYAEGQTALRKAIELSQRFDEKAAYELDSHLNRALTAGVDALSARHFDEAVRQFRYAAEIAPESAVAFKGLGNAHYISGQFEAAEAAYVEAAALAPEDLEIRLNLAELALRRNDFETTVRHARDALALHPDHPEGLQRLAYGAMLAGQYELADEAFQKYLGMPAGKQAVRDYAFMSFNAGRYAIAIPYLNRLAEEGDADGKLRFMLGEAYFALDRYRDMADVYAHLVEEFPDNQYALQGLIVANERLGNVSETLSLRSRLKRIWEQENTLKNEQP